MKYQFTFERAYAYAIANGFDDATAQQLAAISEASRRAIFGRNDSYQFDISKYEDFLANYQ